MDPGSVSVLLRLDQTSQLIQQRCGVRNVSHYVQRESATGCALSRFSQFRLTCQTVYGASRPSRAISRPTFLCAEHKACTRPATNSNRIACSGLVTPRARPVVRFEPRFDRLERCCYKCIQELSSSLRGNQVARRRVAVAALKEHLDRLPLHPLRTPEAVGAPDACIHGRLCPGALVEESWLCPQGDPLQLEQISHTSLEVLAKPGLRFAHGPRQGVSHPATLP